MATISTSSAPSVPAAAPPSSGVVFEAVTWDDYEAMLRIVGERPIRVTYDRGTMEVFMPSFWTRSFRAYVRDELIPQAARGPE